MRKVLNPVRPKRENPERLRECLEALAKHSGNDVFRFELSWSQRGVTLFITGSSLVKEEAITARVVGELRPYFDMLTDGLAKK